MIKRSVTIRGHDTSLSLEPLFWEVLTYIAALQKKSRAALVCEIEERALALEQFNLSSAVRLYVLEFVLMHSSDESLRAMVKRFSEVRKESVVGLQTTPV